MAFPTSHPVAGVGLAVREEVSRPDGEHRFVEGGRWTPPALHDLWYRMMPETIRVLTGSSAVQRVTITDRTADDLYVLDKTSGRTTDSPAESAATFEDIRARPVPPKEARAWMNRQRDTVTAYAVRGAIDDTSRPNLVRIPRAAHRRKPIQQRLYAARSPLTDEAAGRRDEDTVIDDPDVQATLDIVASSHPRGTSSISGPQRQRSHPRKGPYEPRRDPAAELD